MKAVIWCSGEAKVLDADTFLYLSCCLQAQNRTSDNVTCTHIYASVYACTRTPQEILQTLRAKCEKPDAFGKDSGKSSKETHFPQKSYKPLRH